MSIQGNPAGADPDRTLIIVSDDGKIYKLQRDDWQQEKFELQDDPGAAGIVNQLTTFGSYVAFVKKDIALAIGACCTVVNLRSILKGAGVAEQVPAQQGAYYGKTPSARDVRQQS